MENLITKHFEQSRCFFNTEKGREIVSGKYGMPYKGGKSAIAEKIIDVLPSADCFVDMISPNTATES